MQLGAVFPTNEIGNDLGAIREWVQTAEGLGYHSIIAYDHVLGAEHTDREPPLWGPYTERDPFHEPMVLFGWMAALTSRIQLLTGVIVAPQRQTALLAKQAIQIDRLSEGRLILGVATGWNSVEYEALGTDFASRGARLDEQIEVMRHLFRERIVDFDGAYHRIDRAGLLPEPVRDIPIWLGGGSPPSLRRAARYGDGFIFGSAGKRTHAMLSALSAELTAVARSLDGFPTMEIVDHASGPDAWRSEADAWAALGGTHVAVQTMDIIYRWRGGVANGFTTSAEHINALETFATELRERTA
jgi:probable F420-dependent oxidoreductase